MNGTTISSSTYLGSSGTTGSTGTVTSRTTSISTETWTFSTPWTSQSNTYLTTSVKVEKTSQSPVNSTDNTGAIVAVVISSVIGVLLIVGGIFFGIWFYRSRKNKQKQEGDHSPPSPPRSGDLRSLVISEPVFVRGTSHLINDGTSDTAGGIDNTGNNIQNSSNNTHNENGHSSNAVVFKNYYNVAHIVPNGRPSDGSPPTHQIPSVSHTDTKDYYNFVEGVPMDTYEKPFQKTRKTSRKEDYEPVTVDSVYVNYRDISGNEVDEPVQNEVYVSSIKPSTSKNRLDNYENVSQEAPYINVDIIREQLKSRRSLYENIEPNQ